MNGDITQLGDFLNTWLPEQFNKTIPPIVDRAEQNISLAHDKIRSTIRDNVVNSRLAVSKAQTTVMDHIADRLGSVESRIDSAHKKILTNLDEKLIPLEMMIPFGGGIPVSGGSEPVCPPCTKPVADPIFPNAPGICVPDPTCTTGGIDNVPICPPQPICPPEKPCAEMDLWLMPCKEDDRPCVYMMPSGSQSLSRMDVKLSGNIPCQPDPIGFSWHNGLAQCKYITHKVDLLCPKEVIPIVPEPPLVPFPPGCCPQIINIQNPPGGIINNQPTPTFPIINEPTPPSPIIIPPYPTPIPPGFGLNIQVICAAGGTKPGKCPPAGDMAYYSLECNDDSKIKQLWNEIMGTDLNGIFGEKNLKDWWNDKTKDWKTATTNLEDVIGQTFGSLGVE